MASVIFFIAGDFNARVGNRSDFVETEFLHKLEILPDEYVEDTFLSKSS